MIGFVQSDGGRAAAGYKGTVRDCVVRAIAIAARLPYRTAYEGLAACIKAQNAAKGEGLGRSKALRRQPNSPRDGVFRDYYHQYILSLGFRWTPTMAIGQGCRVHVRADELPPGRLIVKMTRHVAAVIDGVLYDLDDCSRNGTRCVYGYYEYDETLKT